MTHDVAVVGTGPDPENPTVEGFAMGYRHAEAFRSEDRCELVACADIVPENAEAFAETFDLPEDAVYQDYEQLVAEREPDVVSVAVPPTVHEEVVVDLAETGLVDAVHCEKPMADTLPGARRMVEACDAAGVQLTINRQRRFGRPFTEAEHLLEAGDIGDLERVEIGWGDFYDTGAHTVDLAGKFADESPPEWVIAQLDYREEDLRFGAHQENQMFAQWRYENGVHGLLSTGPGSDLLDCAIALRGTEGTIRIDVADGPMLELDREGRRETVDVGGETLHNTPNEEGRFGSRFHDRAVSHLVDCLESGEQPEIAGELGLNTANIIFGGYDSVRRRGRVHLPADVADNPLEAMVEAGDLTPE